MASEQLKKLDEEIKKERNKSSDNSINGDNSVNNNDIDDDNKINNNDNSIDNKKNDNTNNNKNDLNKNILNKDISDDDYTNNAPSNISSKDSSNTSISSKIEGFGTNIGNKISTAISNKLPHKLQNQTESNRRHANFNLLVLVIFVSAVFLASAFLYHFQLSFFYNQLLEKDAELDDMESKLTTHLSRFEESQEELSDKAQYELDLINRYSETQETSESLESQIKLFSDTVVQRQNRLVTETKTYLACDVQRDELLEENTGLKEDLLEVVGERTGRQRELDSCLAET